MSIQMTCPAAADLPQVAVDLSYWQTDRDALQVHPGDLGWHSMVGPEKTAANLRIWSRNGTMVALGLLDGPDVLRMAIDPAAQDDDELAQQISSDVNDPDIGILPAGKGIIEARSARSLRKVLADEGWTDDELWTSFHCDLSRPIDKEPIERTQVRVEKAGPDEAEAWVTVHWSAFKGTEFGDADKERLLQKWKNLAEGPFAHLARHLIAFDQNDVAVAVTTAWSAGKGRPGLIEPMGVHRDHHRRGYGAAIVTAATVALKEMGSSSAGVAAENANSGALATYAKAGFSAQEPVADLKRPA